jgi:hypothetical protein
MKHLPEAKELILNQEDREFSTVLLLDNTELLIRLLIDRLNLLEVLSMVTFCVLTQRDIFPHHREFHPANSARESCPIYKLKLEWPFDGIFLQDVAVCRMPVTIANEAAHGLPIPQRFASRKWDKTTASEPSASSHFLL